MKEEIWKPVVGYEGIYSVSEYGNIRREINSYHDRFIKGYILTPSISKKGYAFLRLSKDGVGKMFSIAGLVAGAFIGPRPYRRQVNHKDCNKRNNHYSNLEYVTCRENLLHAMKNNLTRYCRGEKSNGHKITEKMVLEIREIYSTGNFSQKELAKKYGIKEPAVSHIINRRNWKHI